ncbi:hypothetical protein GCM10025870_10690 [Agromyces marinus]|uniref:Endonuclease/Exonuclease/phosphatase family protein n=1 Tax=Agromyces marinus TaxID=1389020 RepID=A0ABN6Y9Z3_9MICO|nr:hypothetical protein GCM10025870_10690 [Agromyces marinus]
MSTRRSDRSRTTHRTPLVVASAAALALGAGVLAAPAQAAPGGTPGRADTVRVATYNLSLNRNVEGQLVADLSTGANAQAKTVAEVIQRANPDIVLLNEFDYVEGAWRSTCSARTTSRSRRPAPTRSSTRTRSSRRRTRACRAGST